MARQQPAPDREFRSTLNEVREMIATLYQQDGNEAETRRRVKRIFERLLGYDLFQHLTREHAVRGAGGN